MKHANIIVMAGSTVLAACASAPMREHMLEQARNDVQTLSQDPAATEVASPDLSAARESLSQADDALKRRNQEDLDHYAYLASRQARTGQARIAEREARRQVAQGEAERNRVLLEARSQELKRSRQETLAAQRSLEDAQQTARGTVLTLSDVLFDTSQATLKPGAGPALDRVSHFMAENSNMRVIIEGHADSRGSAAYNEELSRRRALAVADALATRGVARNRIEPIGRGANLPVASNETSEGQQRNRRVELVFSDNAGHFAQGATDVRRR
jgi:OmpA-OmpF porin, OOP family